MFFVNRYFKRFIALSSESSLSQIALETVFRKLIMFPMFLNKLEKIFHLVYLLASTHEGSSLEDLWINLAVAIVFFTMTLSTQSEYKIRLNKIH